MTPAGIEPATFRFVVQHLNHSTTAVPQSYTVSRRNRCTLKSHDIPVKRAVRARYTTICSKQNNISDTCNFSLWLITTEVFACFFFVRQSDNINYRHKQVTDLLLSVRFPARSTGQRQRRFRQCLPSLVDPSFRQCLPFSGWANI